MRIKDIQFKAAKTYEPHLTWPSREKFDEVETIVCKHEQSTKSLLILKASFCDLITKCIMGKVCITRVARVTVDWLMTKFDHEKEYHQVVSYFAAHVPADPADHQIRTWCDRMDYTRLSKTIADQIVDKKLVELGDIRIGLGNTKR